MQADQNELRKRIGAAAGYEGLTVTDLAKKLGMGRTTLYRRLAGVEDANKRDAFLVTVAGICHLPPAFFTVDFNRLPELERPAATTPAGDPTDERLQELAGEVDELRSMHAAHAAQVIERIAALETTIAGRSQSGPPQ